MVACGWKVKAEKPCREDIAEARRQWQAFMAEAPPYPATAFAGRGIVILAGGLTYMVPAWVNIHLLRRTGMLLPSCIPW